ncbi:MAG: hypothetical protein IVW55_13580 [Chloroflexi bacterium]|nr:hypothetical protein [Chloroflexota bacterium]
MMDSTGAGAEQYTLRGINDAAPDAEPWPFANADSLREALREQGENEDAISSLVPALEQLPQWRAPAPGPADSQTLIEALSPLLPSMSSQVALPIPGSVAPMWVAVPAKPQQVAPNLSQVREALQQQTSRSSWEQEIGYFLEIALAQVGLLRPRFWLVSGIIAAVGMLTIPGTMHNYEVQIATLRVIGPLMAVLAVGIVFRSTNLGVIEIELSCFASPVRLLLARLVVVLSYDVALGLLASVVLASAGAVGGDSLLLLTLHWLAPLLLVAGAASLLSNRMPAEAATGIAYSGWLVLVAWTMGEQGRGVLSSLLGATEGIVAAFGFALLVMAVLRARSLVSSTLPRF